MVADEHERTHESTEDLDVTEHDISEDVDQGTTETEEGEHDEPEVFTREQLEEEVQRAKAAVQSAKDRRIATLEAQIRAVQDAEQVPTFKSVDEELAWHRDRVGRANAMRSTEARIAADLADLSEKLGTDIKRDDPRLDVRTRESYETSLKAIEREEALRKKVPSTPQGKGTTTTSKPRRPDAHRYEGGSSSGSKHYDPKQFEHSGDVYAALVARREAGL